MLKLIYVLGYHSMNSSSKKIEHNTYSQEKVNILNQYDLERVFFPSCQVFTTRSKITGHYLFSG